MSEKITNQKKSDLNLDIWEDNELINKNVVSVSSSTNQHNVEDTSDLFSSVLNHYEPTHKSSSEQNKIITNVQKTKVAQKIPNQVPKTKNKSKKKKKLKNVKVSLKFEGDNKWSEYDAYY